MNLTSLPARRRVADMTARAFLAAAASLSVLILAWLLWRMAAVGVPHIDWQFLTGYPSRNPETAGILPSIVGSLWLGVLTIAFAVPLGVMGAIYLNEYARVNRLTRLIRIAIANLAGTPSVVFGLLGLALFVRYFGFGQILLAGALTLALLVLPIVVVATEEALKAVPTEIRQAAYGLGATKWQVTKDHVLPYAMAGILTGSILALARGMGETAPLILVGGATAIFYLPDNPLSLYTALPLQAFHWASIPQQAFRDLASAAGVVLLALILGINMVAILLRNHFSKKIRW